MKLNNSKGLLKRLSLTLVITVIASILSCGAALAEADGAAVIGDTVYPTLKAAIESAKDGDVIMPAQGSVVIDSGCEAALSGNAEVRGFTFRDGGYLKVIGNHDFALKDCVFAAQKPFTATGAAIPVSLAVTGKLTVTGNDFSKAADGAYYNCVESGYGGEYRVKNGSSFSNNKFGNVPGSAISVFAVDANANISISGNSFKSCSNPVLLGNMRYEKVAAKFDMNGNSKTAEAGFVTLNDNGTDKHEIFTGYTIKITNLKCGASQTIAASNEPHQYIVNSRGVINPPDNMPTVVFDTVQSPSASAEAAIPPTEATVTPAVTPSGGAESGAPTEPPAAQPTDIPTAAPTEVPTAVPTAAPTAVPTKEPTAEPTVEPTLEISAEPEATELPSVSAEPEATETPAPLRTVTVLASSDITAVTITDKNDPSNSLTLMKDEADGAFKGAVRDGYYKISAEAVEGKEVDLKNSSLTLLVRGEDASAAVATIEAGKIAKIAISSPPAKLTYKEGEKFDPSGLELTVTYNDEDTPPAIVKYDDNTAKDFAFVPNLDAALPNSNPYDTGRTMTVIYGNRAAEITLDYILNTAAAYVTAPDVNKIADSAVTVPENACYTAAEAVWSPTIYPGSNYNYGTAYHVTVEFTAKDGFTFSNTEDSPAAATVNDRPASVENISADGKKLTAVYLFPKTYMPGGSLGNSNFSTSESTPRPTTKPALNTYDHFAYIVGYPDGKIRPENNITRDEVATIFFRLLTDNTRDIYWTRVNHYIDVPEDLWSNNAISTLTNAGILGGDGTAYFRPADYITRAEFATIAARFSDAVTSGSGKFKDVNGHWSEEYVEIAAEEGWIQGYEDGTFKPDQNITRAEAMTIVNNVLERKVHASGLLSGMATWSDNKNTSEWYYAAVQEATNTHNYKRSRNTEYETWTEIGDNPDWVKLEQQWSSSGSAGSIN